MLKKYQRLQIVGILYKVTLFLEAGDFHEEIRGVLERGGREERRSNLTSNIVDISASYGLASNIQ